MPNKRKRHKRRRGTPYEQVVAEVLSVMDPGATVAQGQWVVGPDGVRELDVQITGSIDGQQRRVLVECKDFNPESTGPVGIGFVDALESKARDLPFDFAALCSNAGFTEGAIRKASRVGIGLVSVMKKGDRRIRYAVAEEIYTRQLKVLELKISLQGPEPISLDGVRFEHILFEGARVGNWVVQQAMVLIASNPIVGGSYTARFPFTQEHTMQLPQGPARVSELAYHLKISGGWFAQQVTLDATHGIYDWLRHRVRLAPGPGQFLINGVDIYAGTPIEKPPVRELEHISKAGPGELVTRLLLVTGLEPGEPIPPIGSYVRAEDLETAIPDLPPEAYTSSVPNNSLEPTRTAGENGNASSL